MTINKRKYPKWNENWEKEVIKLVGQETEIDKTFKKGEKKPDGTEVTTDAGETIKIKVNDVENSLTEIKAQDKVVKDKLEEITEKRGYKGKAKLIYKAYRQQKERVAEWKNNDYSSKYTGFLGSDNTGTKYQNQGWLKLVADYNKTNNVTNYTNLYDNITEQEVLKIITQTLQVIGKVKTTEFHNALTDNIITAPVFTGDLAGKNINDVKQWFDTCQKHAKTLVESKNEHRTEYSLGSDYTKEDQTGLKNDEFTKVELDEMLNLVKFIQLNSTWLAQDKVKVALIDIVAESEIVVRPAEAEAYTEKQLHDWGVEGYTDNNFANSEIKTHFYGTAKDWAKAKKIKIKDGIRGWSNLLVDYFANHNSEQWIRFTSSFDNSGTIKSPYHAFFADIRSMNEFAAFQHEGTGNYDWTLLNFPEYLDEAEDRLLELEAEKDSIQTETRVSQEELLKAEKEHEETKVLLKTKQKELEKKITAQIAKLRTELKDKFKVSETETNDFTGEKMITYREHFELQKLIGDIRFLVNNDEEKPTGLEHEDDAYKVNEEILKQYVTDFAPILQIFNEIDYQTGTTESRITIIKENKDNKYGLLNLNYFHDKLVELAKIVKLTPEQTEIKTKLKATIDNQTPTENLQDWRNTLKSYDAGLATTLTDEIIAKWKEKKDGQDAFNNIAGLTTLLNKVGVFEKATDGTNKFKEINPDFLTSLQDQDSELKTLADLFTKEGENPKKIITLIEQWVYSKLEETKKKEKWLKFAWSEKGGKQKIDNKDKLEDSEKDKFNEFLYDCAIGKINYHSLKKPTDQQKDEKSPLNEKGHFAQYWHWYLGGTVLTIGLILIIFWEQISNWLNKPTEEPGETTEDDE